MVKDKLRKAEKLVLSRLEVDSRRSFSSFAGRIRMSQQRVSYIVKSMIEKGIINGFYTLIDYSRLDVLNFRVYFRVSYIEREKIVELIKYLIADPHTSWVSTCGGRFDIICTFLALNPSQFNKTLKEIMEKFPKQLQNYMVLTTIVNRDFGRKYLFRKTDMITQKIFGGDREPKEIDELDMNILDNLAENARESSVKLGGRLNVTAKTIIQRIDKLKKNKIIKGFRPFLDPRNTGHIPTALLIKYHNISTQLEDQLINYLKVHKNVISAVKTLGEWDLEIWIEVETPAELREIEIEIRQRFAELIQETESVPMYRTYKINYFPKFLLEK